MNLVMFSRAGVHYESGGKGDLSAIFVPMREQVRRYTDIPHITGKTVKERYGESTNTPMWRQRGDVVNVYGTILEELKERRQGLEVFLPQDYAPQGCNAFYFVFGDRWIVHGIRTITDDGAEAWGISRIDSKDGSIVDAVTNAVSERMLEGNAEESTIAIQGDDALREELQRAVTPLGLKVVRFAALSRQKDLKPIYVHRDFSLVMLTFALFSLLILMGVITYLALGKLKLDEMEREIVSLEEQIRRAQENRPLGHIRNPQKVLAAMEKNIKQPPSSILHAVGDTASAFGALRTVEFRNKAAGKNQVESIATLSNVENELLLYQEEVGKSVLRDRPWVRSVERVPGRGKVNLRIILKVE